MIIALDLDGTLITAKERQSLLLFAVCARYKYYLDTESAWIRKKSGATNFQLLSDLSLDKKTVRLVCDSWLRDIETPYWLSVDKLFFDVIDMLSLLKQKGMRLVLITARKNEYLMRQQIYRLGINTFFDEVHCVSPERAIIEKYKALCYSKSQAFIGDTETDFYSASLAGVSFYGVNTGQRGADFLKEKGVCKVSDSLSSSIKKIFGENI
jgi:phosphoglycolate phosphatase-like HAD superfamily hydrolase